MKIGLSNKSKRNLSAGLDYRLAHMLMEALKLEYKHDWGVYETKRTIEQQKQNVAKGVSWTMNSKHIPDNLGIIRAFDVVPWISPWGWSWNGDIVGGGYSEEKARKTKECFDELISNLRKIASELYLGQITFGEDFKNVDRPHVEIKAGQEIK